MAHFSVSTVVHGPIDLVADALEHPRNTPQWSSFASRFDEVKSASSAGEKCFVTNLTSGDMDAQLETILVARDQKTKVTLKWSGRAHGVFTGFMLLVLRRKMRKQAQRELARFRKLVETRGADFGPLN